MRIKYPVWLVLPAMLLAFAACKNDPPEPPEPDPPVCSTENITYQNRVEAIMEQYCTACHSGSSPDAGILLTTYEQVKQQALEGLLYDSMAHNPNATPMPYLGQKVPDCTLSQIAAWIADDAPEN
ncbi:MAG: hypothetical protein EA392_04495 [Cryomorphaceae bacterium]|nr:MAG: hypothetical protein EA392_04495 [Cryomorphaceae bacterium]